MNAKRIAGALMVSLVIIGIIMLIASFYMTQTVQFKDLVARRGPSSEGSVNPSSSVRFFYAPTETTESPKQ